MCQVVDYQGGHGLLLVFVGTNPKPKGFKQTSGNAIIMNVRLSLLDKSHFSLLLKWLETPHVKAWWDSDIDWTLELIEQKYGSYTKGYKLIDGMSKPINAYVINIGTKPVGYIQIYNAYDFPRTKSLVGLPPQLATFDVFIGEEAYLNQGIGSQAIKEIFEQYKNYTHLFADPDINNVAAIRTYEKAGLKIIGEQLNTGEVWMMKEILQRPQPLETIQKLLNERYRGAKAIFWAGSVSRNQGTKRSDLDLVIVYENLPTAYREAFIYDDWPIDAFVHSLESLNFFFEESRDGNGISGLIYMIMHGVEVNSPNDFSAKIRTIAQEFYQAGPKIWDKNQIDKERFLTTDILEDIKFPASREEQIASAASLYEPLAQFYFRSQGKWCASGKSVIRYLEAENPILAKQFTKAFADVFQKGNTNELEILVKKILECVTTIINSQKRQL